MSAIVHLVRSDAEGWWPRTSVCGRVACRKRAGQGYARGSEQRSQVDCRACLAAVLPGAHGGTANDPDSIDVEQARNAVDHYTRKLVEPRTITKG